MSTLSENVAAHKAIRVSIGERNSNPRHLTDTYIGKYSCNIYIIMNSGILVLILINTVTHIGDYPGSKCKIA